MHCSEKKENNQINTKSIHNWSLTVKYNEVPCFHHKTQVNWFCFVVIMLETCRCSFLGELHDVDVLTASETFQFKSNCPWLTRITFQNKCFVCLERWNHTKSQTSSCLGRRHHIPPNLTLSSVSDAVSNSSVIPFTDIGISCAGWKRGSHHAELLPPLKPATPLLPPSAPKHKRSPAE